MNFFISWKLLQEVCTIWLLTSFRIRSTMPSGPEVFVTYTLSSILIMVSSGKLQFSIGMTLLWSGLFGNTGIFHCRDGDKYLFNILVISISLLRHSQFSRSRPMTVVMTFFRTELFRVRFNETGNIYFKTFLTSTTTRKTRERSNTSKTSPPSPTQTKTKIRTRIWQQQQQLEQRQQQNTQPLPLDKKITITNRSLPCVVRVTATLPTTHPGEARPKLSCVHNSDYNVRTEAWLSKAIKDKKEEKEIMKLVKQEQTNHKKNKKKHNSRAWPTEFKDVKGETNRKKRFNNAWESPL